MTETGGRFSKRVFLSEKGILLLGLTVLSVAVQSVYCFNVIPPQSGWWQYYAWRLAEGEVLYKDVYCFLQPYFIWFMTLLYKIFGTHFVRYIVTGVILRTLSLICVYLLFCRNVRPLYAFLGVFSGFVLSVAYLMDMAFDYNTLIVYLLVLTVYVTVKAYECKTESRRAALLILSGALSGVHFMIKQSSGLIVPVMTAILVLFLDFRDGGAKSARRHFALFLCGVFPAVLPGYVAIAAQGAFPAYLECLFGSTEAKIANGFTGLYRRFVNEMFEPCQLVVALLLAVFVVNAGTRTDGERALRESERGQGYLRTWLRGGACLLLATGVFAVCLKYEDVVYARLKNHGGESLALIAVLFSAAAAFGAYSARARRDGRGEEIAGVLFVLLSAGVVFAAAHADFSFSENLYRSGLCRRIARCTVNVSFYFTGFYLLADAVHYLATKKFFVGKAFYIFAFVLFFLNCTMLLSSVLEELGAMPSAAGMLALLLQAGEGYKEKAESDFPESLLLCGRTFRSAEEKGDGKSGSGERRVRVLSGIRNTATCAFSLLLIFLCVVGKTVVPYSWHGWQVSSLNDPGQTYVRSGIDGLEGYRLTAYDERAYREIIRIIEENTGEEDAVYQFANIPLFNVLTKRKIPTYAPVCYWDVCPDGVAEQAARTLWENPPKIVLWAKMSEETWRLHEIYFRDGAPSGQREIGRFYEEYVVSHYTKSGEYDGNLNTLEIWVRD